jgi:predicted transposase YdaD
VPQPFDATTKELIENQPADWLVYLGFSRVAVEVINADLSTVTAAADKVLRVREPTPWLVHLELQASRDVELPDRHLQYNVLLKRRHRLPVRSVIVLLRPEADGPELTGVLEHHLPDGEEYLRFRYRVVRVWERPVEAVLAGGLGTLPLAPLSQVSEDALPGVVRQMEQRLNREAAPGEVGQFWTATFVLMGLRYPPHRVAQLLQGVRGMKESATYQMILREGREEGREEGRVEEARAILLRQGTKRFGPPSEQARTALEATRSIERLELLTERLLDVESWEELLVD